MANNAVIRVAIVDDHQLFAETLAMGLTAVPDIEVAQTYADGAALLAGLDDLEVDVLIIDLEMPGVTGIDILEADAELPPTLVVTMHSSEEQRERATNAGATGFLAKSAPLRDVAAAVRALAQGATLLEIATLREVLDANVDPVLDPRAAALTARERELLVSLAAGTTSTADLAHELFISEKTVKNHLASIFEKLEVADRAQAALEAIKLGVAPRS